MYWEQFGNHGLRSLALKLGLHPVDSSFASRHHFGVDLLVLCQIPTGGSKEVGGSTLLSYALYVHYRQEEPLATCNVSR
jgi:hypothetical protein